MWTRPRAGARVDEIERVYRRRYAEHVRVARAILGDAESARDAVQEGYASALRRRETFRGEGPLEAWLWRAVVNAALSARRRREPLAELPSEGNGTTPDGDVRAALALLPERQRLAVFLRYYADLDYPTIAAVLAVSEGTVAATLHAAHRALRRRLEEVPP